MILPPLGEAGFSIARLCTYVRVCMHVTTLQHCGGIRAIQALSFYVYIVLDSDGQLTKKIN